MMHAATSKNQRVLLKSVLADATTDSRRGAVQESFRILLPSNSFGIRRPAAASITVFSDPVICPPQCTIFLQIDLNYCLVL